MADELVREEGTTGGDVVGGNKITGDKITVGNISDSYAAIGEGAQVIVQQIQEALSAVDELDKSIQAAERRLAEAIQKKIGGYTKLTATDVDGRGNPYKALLDYKIEDAPFFYGRSAAIEAMREKLANSRLTILHSDSGSGKTSLLQAGLASRLLAEGQFPLYLRPYDQRPDQFIKKAFLPDYATQADLARFSDEQMTLHGFLERVTHYLGERRLVIFLDQFEEFFTELTPEQQKEFAKQLRECVESDLPVWWVLALRKEYFSDLRLFAALKPFENEFFLPTFKLDEAQEVVVEPAAQKAVGYETGLVDQILDDIRQDSADIPPAQVQLVCYTLFDELPGDGSSEQITFALYNEPRGRPPGAPGAEGILTSHLSRVLDRELKGKERKVAGLVLEALVTSDVRRVMRGREELLESLDMEQAALLAPVLKALYDNRLVRRELDENDEPVYELAHDYLLNEIELDPETQARKAAQELLNQEAQAYRQHGTLLSEDKFVIINNQHENLQIDESATELLEKSEAAIEAERRRELEREQRLAEEQRKRAEEAEARHQAEEEARVQAEARAHEAEAAADAQRKSSFRLRRLVYGLVIVVIAALLSAWFANRQAQIAKARSLIAESQLQISKGNLNLATLLALEAKQVEPEIAERILGDQIPNNLRPAVFSNAILGQHESQVTSVAWSPDGQTLASTSSDMTVRLWDVERRELLQTLQGHVNGVNSVGWSPDGRTLATGSEDRTIKLWDVERGELLQTLLGHGEAVRSVSWSPDGRTLASGSKDGAIKLWDVERGEPLHALQGHEGSVNSVAWSPDGRRLASGSSDSNIVVWDAERGEPIQTLQGNGASVYSVAWSPDGSELVSGSSDRTIRLWDVEQGELLQTLQGHEDSVSSVAWSPDGRMLASGAGELAIKLWDVDRGELVQSLLIPGERGWINSVAWSPDGRTLASGSVYNEILLWDAGTAEAQQNLLGHGAGVHSVAWSPNSRILASASSDKTIKLWDAERGELLKTLQDDSVFHLAWSPDGLTLASGAFGVNLWNVERGELLQTLQYDEAVGLRSGRERPVAWSPDGRTLASGSTDGRILLWDAVSGELLQTLPTDRITVRSMAWSPDGRTLAFGSNFDDNIRLLDVDGGEPLRTFRGHTDTVSSMAWSPDGRKMALGSHDGTVELRDVQSGELLQTLEGHDEWINSVNWSPDGRVLASGSSDDTVRLWDTENGELLRTLRGHIFSVDSVAWSPDGRTLASASSDTTIKLWPAWTTRPSCEWTYANLTPEEWVQFMGSSVYRPTCPAHASEPAPSIADAFRDNADFLLITWPGRIATAAALLIPLTLILYLLWITPDRPRIIAIIAAIAPLLALFGLSHPSFSEGYVPPVGEWLIVGSMALVVSLILVLFVWGLDRLRRRNQERQLMRSEAQGSG